MALASLISQSPIKQSMARVAASLVVVLVTLFVAQAQAAIVYVGGASGHNDALPTTAPYPGALTISKPVGTVAGHALIASIAARPSGMAVTVPAGWFAMTVTQQPAGGVSTAPGGMTLLTYYHIVGTAEPANYTWTFANNDPAHQGGSAVGGILAFSGIDTSGASPIDGGGLIWSAILTGSVTATLTHSTSSITTVTDGDMIVSSISYLSASSFANPTGSILTFTERLDQSAPIPSNAIGTTIQMSTAPQAVKGATGTSQAVAAANADSGVGHLMALKPAQIDPALGMTRSGPLNPGFSASYTMTVTNNGSMAEPGPLTIVDTLPSGLTYASASGSGWSCSAAGQVVTCTRNGAVPGGGSAPALVLTVNVGALASGVITNTATVSGTGGDGNMANNTAVDTYIAQYAYYAMDEAGWSATPGVVADTGGSVAPHNGSVLGTATATGNPPPASPGAAIAGSPGTCGAGKVPAGVTAIGVDTGIDANNIGNAGTIMLWYSGNAAWNDGNNRMLFDASNAAGNKYFFLAKTSTGALQFGLKDTAGTATIATSGNNAFAANQWHHITVTWDLSVNSIVIYLDGNAAPVATSATVLNGVLGDMATLYLGAQRMAGVTLTPAGYTANSANGYIDEARIFTRALSTAEIATIKNLTHACAAGVNHYDINNSGTGLTCEAEPVTFSAHDSAHGYVNAGGKTISLTTSTGKGAWSTTADSCVSACFDGAGTQITCTGTFTPTVPNANNGQASYTFGSGEVGVRLCLKHNLTGTVNVNVTDGSSNESTGTAASEPGGADPDMVFSDTGFRFFANGAVDAITNQIAGVRNDDGANHPSPQTLTIQALKSSTTTPARCVALLSNVTRTVQFGYRCESNPSTCSASLPKGLQVNATSVTGYNASVSPVVPSDNVSVTFDVTGAGSINLKYFDVGNISVWARATSVVDATTGSTFAVVTGNSNTFTVKPYAFTVDNISPANPGASTGTGAAFIKAGSAFSARVTAIALGAATTPSFGRCDSAGGTGCTAASESVGLASVLVAPASGANPALGGTTASNASNFVANNGYYTFTNLSWAEVGIITLKATNANYLSNGLSGTYKQTAGSSGNVGRFYPDHFDTAVTVQGCGTFTYSGQAFTTTVTAKNGLGVPGTTVNYDGTFGFSKAVTLTDSSGAAGSLSNGAVLPAAFVAGVATTATPVFTFTSTLTAPATINLRATETFNNGSTGDGVTSLRATPIEGTTPIRSGRIKMSNAHGSELLDLPISLAVQYWNGTAFVSNAADTCTVIAAANFAFSYPVAAANHLAACETAVSVTGSAPNFTVKLIKPGANNNGWTDLTLNLGVAAGNQCTSVGGAGAAATTANAPWLQYNWKGAVGNPTARATFGIYKGGPIIYMREMY